MTLKTCFLSLLLTGILLLPAPEATAQTPKTALPPIKRIALRAARLLDVSTGRYIDHPVILIEGERITAVGSQIAIPAGVTVLDLGDKTVLPGLIDCHTHLMASSGDDYGTMLLTKSQATRALEGAANARKTLLAGFTSVRDVENEGSGYADVALRDAINRGLVEGPRMLVATRGIAAVGQYFPFGVSPDLPNFPHGAQMISGVEEARRAVREQIGYGADLIKVYADWEYPTLTVDEMRVVVEEAHKAKKRVAAHATMRQGIQNALEAGVDSIEHGFGADRANLEMMKQKGVWLVPTRAVLSAQLQDVKNEQQRKMIQVEIDTAQKSLRMAHDIGVKIANGYDPANEAEHGTNAREFSAIQAAGLTNFEIIRAATVSASELLGWQDQVGSVEAGKYADLVAVSGDPLKEIKVLEQVVFVMKSGKIITNDTAKN